MRIMDAPPEPTTSLRAKRSNPLFLRGWMDCFALLAMTAESCPGDARAQPNSLNQINAIRPVRSLAKNISLWRAPKIASLSISEFQNFT
ncbi:MAG TPA: hypothetical protein VK779_12470 [Rhizomicrobium sp.]|nr:hypothetical protein [Rhizomicrobium sp.]